MTDFDHPAARPRLLAPSLAGLYRSLEPVGETVLRFAAGALLVTHGYGKIINPFGATGMVESLGFYPGNLWSLLLACTEFFGGIFVALGFLTRPASFAAMIVLLVTVYFHGVVQGEGLAGAEKSILWTAIFLFFALRGSNRYSVDAAIGRQI